MSSRRKSTKQDPVEALIPLLPTYDYTDPAFGDRPPRVTYTRCAEEVDDLLHGLKGYVVHGSRIPAREELIPDTYFRRPLGFDMEWKISFNKGHEFPTGLVQVADKDTILLIQTSFMKGPYISPSFTRID
jgi:hypothetical protein